MLSAKKECSFQCKPPSWSSLVCSAAGVSIPKKCKKCGVYVLRPIDINTYRRSCKTWSFAKSFSIAKHELPILFLYSQNIITINRLLMLV